MRKLWVNGWFSRGTEKWPFAVVSPAVIYTKLLINGTQHVENPEVDYHCYQDPFPQWKIHFS